MNNKRVIKITEIEATTRNLRISIIFYKNNIYIFLFIFFMKRLRLSKVITISQTRNALRKKNFCANIYLYIIICIWRLSYIVEFTIYRRNYHISNFLFRLFICIILWTIIDWNRESQITKTSEGFINQIEQVILRSYGDSPY